MKIFTVLSRDRGDFIHTTTDEGEAEHVKKEQTKDEEMAGGRPSVYIRTSTLDEIKIEKFSEGYGQGLEHGESEAVVDEKTAKELFVKWWGEDDQFAEDFVTELFPLLLRTNIPTPVPERYEEGLERVFLGNSKINLERGCKVMTFDEFKSAMQSLKTQGISETDFEQIFDDCTEAVNGRKFSSTSFNRRKAKEAFTKLLQPNVPADIREFIGKAQYDEHGQMIFRDVQDDGSVQMFLDVRGWGAIQNMGFKTMDEDGAFQDKVGQWVTDVINNNLK